MQTAPALLHGLLPATLTRGGLRGGINAVVERLDLDVTVDLPPERFPAEIEASAYFIVAEALTNIVKHANAESAYRDRVGRRRDAAAQGPRRRHRRRRCRAAATLPLSQRATDSA